MNLIENWRESLLVVVLHFALVYSPACLGQSASVDNLSAVRGTWTLKSIYPTPNVQGPSTAQQRKLLGSRISIGNDLLTACKKAVTITSTNVHLVSATDFLADNRVALDAFGIHIPSVTEIVINKRQAGTCFGAFPLPGQDLYIKDQNELVVAFEGIFYRAVREK